MRKLVIATALAVGTAGLAAVAAPAQAGVPWLVTVKADATQVTLGQTVSFTGKVTPGGRAAGLKVVLQEKVAKALEGPGHRQDRRPGPLPPLGQADRQHHAPVPRGHAGHGSARQGREPQGQGHGLRLEQALRPPVGQPEQHEPEGPGQPGRRHVPEVARRGLDRRIVHRVQRRPLCIALKGTFGIDDNSETGAQSTVSALSDGTQVYTHTFAVGEKSVQRIALDSPLKLKFTAHSVVAGVDGYGAIGTPQILCTR